MRMPSAAREQAVGAERTDYSCAATNSFGQQRQHTGKMGTGSSGWPHRPQRRDYICHHQTGDRMKILIALGALAFAAASSLPAAVFDVAAFGAKGDGKTQNRTAINKAIDAAAAAGGGTVDFPAGTWVTGSVHLRSNITL